MQRHECNKYNYLCINDPLKFLFLCENQGVTLAHNAHRQAACSTCRLRTCTVCLIEPSSRAHGHRLPCLHRVATMALHPGQPSPGQPHEDKATQHRVYSRYLYCCLPHLGCNAHTRAHARQPNLCHAMLALSEPATLTLACMTIRTPCSSLLSTPSLVICAPVSHRHGSPVFPTTVIGDSPPDSLPFLVSRS
jgi:hypothetical protein